jgi:hypothetical protein
MPTKTTSRKRNKSTDAPKVRIRMYRQGLGDCFLLTFFTGPKPVNILIDCGTLGSSRGIKMPDIINSIALATKQESAKSHLDVLVATHEHRDHVSGFGGDPSPFDDKTFDVDHVWVAWTEDPNDPLAKQITKQKGDLKLAVALAADALAARTPAAGEENDVGDNVSGMRELFGFFTDVPDGAPLAATLAKTIDSSMRFVTERAGDKGRFLSPGDCIEEDWLPGVRVYVLGPPKSEASLRNMGEHGSPELYSLTAKLTNDLASCSRFNIAAQSLQDFSKGLDAADRQAFEAGLPFDPRFRLESTEEAACREQFGEYFNKENDWRRIDNDWLSGGSEMAMQLDSYTNNTSLVLAFELIEDGRVLLFPADAQVGNWLSWHDPDIKWTVKDAKGKEREVNAADLLARTVFYKVGHHSSHNATVKEHGLELMEREDVLVAMIPVDRKVAMKKTPPWRMPAEALYARLVEKTNGRVLRADTEWPEEKFKPATMSKAEWDSTQADPRFTIDELFIDFNLS